MLFGARIPKLRLSPLPFFSVASRCLRFTVRLSSLPQAKGSGSLHHECYDFLPWLERKAGAEISSVVSVGRSSLGRSLFASKRIKTGDCILKVPFNAQLSPDNLLPEIKDLLLGVGNVARLATVILVEKNFGPESEWAPYITRLPQLAEMQNTLFWSDGELEMLKLSPVYQEAVQKKSEVRREFLAVKCALGHLTLFENIEFEDFMHAYSLVESRAWGSSKGYSLIPLADFLNHDGFAKAVVLNDEVEQLSEVTADRDYAPGEQIWISYGKFSNAILMVDFGFTLPCNIYDEVHMQLNVPQCDPLYKTKLDLLQRYCFSTTSKLSGSKCPINSFTIKEVRAATGKGRGIPQSIRAAARVLCCTTPEELSYMVEEATRTDGRLGRRPLDNINKEIQAHQILLSQMTKLIEEYSASIELLDPVITNPTSKNGETRRIMAYNLLAGELRILQSASTWLQNYIASLLHQASEGKSLAE